MAPRTDYDTLVNEHARVMTSAIRRVLGRRHETLGPDVEQEVRLALWKRLRTGKNIEHPVSYVYKAALTTALGVLKRLAPEAPLDEATMANLEAVPNQDDRRNLLPAERERLLQEMLDKLNKDQSRALRGYLAGMNHREIARLYGWTESVARHRIYRGLEALRSMGG